MRKYEEQLVKKQVAIGYQCDVCNKTEKSNYLPTGWRSFNAHHSEWGNDSFESQENYDVCSAHCYKEQITICIEKFDGNESTKIDGFDIDFIRNLIELL